MLKCASSIFYIERSLGDLLSDLKLFIARDHMLRQGNECFLNKKAKGFVLSLFYFPTKNDAREIHDW